MTCERHCSQRPGLGFSREGMAAIGQKRSERNNHPLSASTPAHKARTAQLRDSLLKATRNE